MSAERNVVEEFRRQLERCSLSRDRLGRLVIMYFIEGYTEDETVAALKSFDSSQVREAYKTAVKWASEVSIHYRYR